MGMAQHGESVEAAHSGPYALSCVLVSHIFRNTSALLYPVTPLVISARNLSRVKSERRNTSSGFIPSRHPISLFKGFV